MVFYGVSGGTTHLAVQHQNEEALSYIAEECVAWGQVPIVIGGDYNLHLSQSLTVTNLLFNGRWCDAAVEHARRCGDLDPPPTCFAKPGVSKGARIDGLLLNSVLAKSFVSLSCPSSGLPTHRPLLLELSLATLNTFVVKHKVPQRIKNVEISKRPSAEACETHALGLWRAVAAEWQRARNNGDVPALWPLLTRTADTFYRWFAGLDSSKRSPVRGLPGSPSLVRVAPPRDRLSDAATSVKTAALQRFIRSLEHASRLRLKLAVDVTSAERFHEFQQLWKRIVGRAHLFVSPVDSPGVFDLGDLQVPVLTLGPSIMIFFRSSVCLNHLCLGLIFSSNKLASGPGVSPVAASGVIPGRSVSSTRNFAIAFLYPSRRFVCLRPILSPWIPVMLSACFGKNGSLFSVLPLSKKHCLISMPFGIASVALLCVPLSSCLCCLVRTCVLLYLTCVIIRLGEPMAGKCMKSRCGLCFSFEN